MKNKNFLTYEGITDICKFKYFDTEEIKVFGFWMYLMSDCVLFCCLFATYAVLVNNPMNDLISKDIFKLSSAVIESICLLFSSLTSGISTIVATYKNKKHKVIFWMILTWLIGIIFISMEAYKLNNLLMRHSLLNSSSFLSAFFVLIFVHSLHVISGLIWIVVLIFQIIIRGLTKTNLTRIKCLSLFWNFLDVVWIFIYFFIYLIGVV